MFVKVTFIDTLLETEKKKYLNVNTISEISYEEDGGSKLIINGYTRFVEETPDEINDQLKVSFKD